MIQEMIERNRLQLRRLGTAAIVAALVMAAYGGLGSGFFCFQIVTMNVFAQNRWYNLIASLGYQITQIAFPVWLLVCIFGFVRWLVNRGGLVPWVVKNADKGVWIYIVIRLLLIISWFWVYKMVPSPEGAPWHDVLLVWLQPTYILLSAVKIVPWAMAAILWPKVVELLRQIDEGTFTIAGWTERNKLMLGRVSSVCGVVGVLMLVYGGLDGYANISRHLARAEPFYWYVTTVTRIAVNSLLSGAILLGVYCIIQQALGRQKRAWPLLLHGDKVIYVYIVFAVVNSIMPHLQIFAQIFERSTDRQFVKVLWISVVTVTLNVLITSLPLVVWGMFAPILKSGVRMMERQPSAYSV